MPDAARCGVLRLVRVLRQSEREHVAQSDHKGKIEANTDGRVAGNKGKKPSCSPDGVTFSGVLCTPLDSAVATPTKTIERDTNKSDDHRPLRSILLRFPSLDQRELTSAV